MKEYFNDFKTFLHFLEYLNYLNILIFKISIKQRNESTLSVLSLKGSWHTENEEVAHN